MTTRWKKVWTDFWGNKTRTFIMVLTIMAGVFAVGFNQNLGLMMNRDMDADFLSANPSEATVYISPIDDDMVAIAKSVEGVGAVEGRSDVAVQLVQPDGKKIPMQVDGLKSTDSVDVNILKPSNPTDTTLPALADNEILLDRTANSFGYQPGDIITVEMSGGKTRQLRVAGYVHDVTSIPYSMSGQATGFVTLDTLEWLGGSSTHYSRLLISVAENPTDQGHVSDVTQAVADRMKKGGATIYFILIFNPGHHFAWETTQGVVVVLSVLSWLTVFLSAFLIINTIVSLMTQHTKQIGIMKAIGGETRQLMVMYIILILSFGAAAFLASVPLAALTAKTILTGMASWLNFDVGPLTIFPQVMTQQAIVAFIVPLLAALIPMLKTVRVTVREALSDYGLGSEEKQKPAKSKVKSLGFISRPVRISMRNVFRRKGRLILTLSTLILSGAIFIAVMNLFGTFDKTMQDVEKYFLADVNVSFNRAYRYDEVAALTMSVPGVKSAEGWMILNGEIVSADGETANELALVAPPSDSKLIEPILTAGRWVMPGDENAVVVGNHLLSVRPDLKVGDWVTLRINEKESDWQIVGIYRIPGNVIPPLVYVNYEYLSRLVNAPGDVYSLRIITDRHDQVGVAPIAKQLQEIYDANGIQVGYVQMASEWRAQQTSQTDVLVYFMLVMAILTAIVGGLGLMGTMSINTLERTREIGVMRAVGASNMDIQMIVLVEGLTIGMISWAVSLLISIPITSILTYGVGVAIFKAPLDFTFGIDGILTWLFGTLIIAALASALPARRASRLTVRDTLAYE
jgi:putative ABC transport system permease protein